MDQKRNRRADKFAYSEGDLVFEDDPDIAKMMESEDDVDVMGPIHPLNRIADEEDLPLFVERYLPVEQQEMYKAAFNEALDSVEMYGLSHEQTMEHASKIAWKFVGDIDSDELVKWLAANEEAFYQSTFVQDEDDEEDTAQIVLSEDASESGRAGRIAGEQSRS